MKNHLTYLLAIVLLLISSVDAFSKDGFRILDDNGEELLYVDNEKAKIYIDIFRHIAISEMDRTGIPASIKMAQGILESGAGQSELSRIAHNHFGIKCGGEWEGKTYYMWDDDVVKSCFRVYSRDEESYIAHSEFLANPKKNWRYGFLFQLERTDYKGWAEGLQKAGYATSKTYARNLISIIERLELYKLDFLSFNTLAVADGELDSIFRLPKIDPPTVDTQKGPIAILIPDPFGANSDTVKMVLTKETFMVNLCKAVYVQPSDNLGDIAHRTSIKVKKLRKYNELNAQAVLRTGQYVFLEKKAKRYKGEEETHVVRNGQKMHDIAQHYGIQLKQLIRLNKVYKNLHPVSGTIIRLR